MIKDIRPYAIAFGSALGLLIVLSVIGNILLSTGVIKNTPTATRYAVSLAFGLFLIMGFSMVPLAIKFVLAGMTSFGLGEHKIIKLLTEHAMTIVYIFWAVYATGLAIALPEMIKSGFFEGK